MLYEHVCYMNNPNTQIFPHQLPYTQYMSVKLAIHNTKQSDCITLPRLYVVVLYHKKNIVHIAFSTLNRVHIGYTPSCYYVVCLARPLKSSIDSKEPVQSQNSSNKGVGNSARITGSRWVDIGILSTDWLQRIACRIFFTAYSGCRRGRMIGYLDFAPSNMPVWI